MNYVPTAGRRTTALAPGDRIPESADIYDIGENTRPIRTTKELALAALHIDLVEKPYVGKEWLLALALGTVMMQMLDAGMPEHKETETPIGASIFSHQLLQAYQQLRNGTGEVERKFREHFLDTYKHFPRDVRDIRGGVIRQHDADMLVRVVRNFCPWPEVANDFENYVRAEDAMLQQTFLHFYAWVIIPQLRGRALVPGRNTYRRRTNTARYTVEQDGTVVKVTFSQRWRMRSARVEFLGVLGDAIGASFKIGRCSLAVCEALALIASFNWTVEEDAMVLDAKVRALGEQGFIVSVHPKTRRPVLVDVRGLKSVFG